MWWQRSDVTSGTGFLSCAYPRVPSAVADFTLGYFRAFPPGTLWFVSGALPPRTLWSVSGIDRSAAIEPGPGQERATAGSSTPVGMTEMLRRASCDESHMPLRSDFGTIVAAD